MSGLLNRLWPGRRPDGAARAGAPSVPPGQSLIIHIGDFKTGTTAIQTWLGAQGHRLALAPGFNQAALAQSLLGPHEGAEAAFAALAGHLAAWPERLAVLSAEHFELVDPARLSAMLWRHLPQRMAGLRLIGYVRPHPGAYLARFAESVKIGSHLGDLDSYLDRPDIPRRLAYGTRLAAWRAVFADRLTVRLYAAEALEQGDVLRDFALFVTDSDPGPELRENPTPGLADIALLRAWHQAMGPLPSAAEGARFTLGRDLGRRLAASPLPDTPLRLHRALAARLRETFGAEAEAADAAFFPGAPLTQALAAAVAEAPPAAQSLVPADHWPAPVLRLITAWGAMAGQGLRQPDGPALLDRLYHE